MPRYRTLEALFVNLRHHLGECKPDWAKVRPLPQLGCYAYVCNGACGGTRFESPEVNPPPSHPGEPSLLVEGLRHAATLPLLPQHQPLTQEEEGWFEAFSGVHPRPLGPMSAFYASMPALLRGMQDHASACYPFRATLIEAGDRVVFRCDRCAWEFGAEGVPRFLGVAITTPMLRAVPTVLRERGPSLSLSLILRVNELMAIRIFSEAEEEASKGSVGSNPGVPSRYTRELRG